MTAAQQFCADKIVPIYERCCEDARGQELVNVGTARHYRITRKGKLLTKAPPGVVTRTLPLVAPAGTVVEIAEPDELTVKADSVPLKVTRVAPVRFVPRIVTASPAPPALGNVLMKGPRPMEKL